MCVKIWKDQMGNRASNLSIQELPPLANLLKDDDLHPYGYHYTTFGLEVSWWAYLDRPKKALLVRTTAYHSHSVM
jgi:hypothetical protein